MARYTQLNLGLSHYGQSTSYSGQLQGGLALHGNGVTRASPYPIQETFGILSVGDIFRGESGYAFRPRMGQMRPAVR